MLRALQLGAAGFLLKDTAPPRIVEAVRTVARDEPVLSPSVTRQVIAAATNRNEPNRQEAEQDMGTLTEREREVAIEIARGISNAEIVEGLHMSVAMKVRDAGLL